MNNELEGIRTEAVVAYLKVLSQNLPGGTEVNHENLSLSPGQVLSSQRPIYKARGLTTLLLHPVILIQESEILDRMYLH
jgi:hypothetical protein